MTNIEQILFFFQVQIIRMVAKNKQIQQLVYSFPIFSGELPCDVDINVVFFNQHTPWKGIDSSLYQIVLTI